MKKQCLFILMIILGNMTIAQDNKSTWFNEQWTFGSSRPAFSSGTLYFFKSDGTFKVDNYYSGGQYIKNSSKGKYFYQPESQAVFLKFPRMKKKRRSKDWSSKKAIQITFSANDTIYSTTTYNDWKKESGKFETKGEPIVFSFPIKFETASEIKLMSDTNRFKNEPITFECHNSFSRKKMMD
jgi:hypothetical protein